MSLIEKYATPELNNPLRTIAIITYEASNFVTNARGCGELADARYDLADIITQCRLLAGQLATTLTAGKPWPRQDFDADVALLLWHLGKLSRCVIYSGVADSTMHPKSKGGYLDEASLRLDDIWSACRALATHFEWTWDVLVADGEERFIERMEEIRKGVI